jgi:hypothetical protein
MGRRSAGEKQVRGVADVRQQRQLGLVVEEVFELAAEVAVFARQMHFDGVAVAAHIKDELVGGERDPQAHVAVFVAEVRANERDLLVLIGVVERDAEARADGLDIGVALFKLLQHRLRAPALVGNARAIGVVNRFIPPATRQTQQRKGSGKTCAR